MLLGADEYPYHQITDTFAAVAGSDPSWNDGHYVCAATADGVVAMASSVRLYANNDVLDGFVCVRHQGRQHNLRLSRRLRPQMDHLGVGPLRLEILEPMRRIRVVLEPNEAGIELDVVCESAHVPYMGPVEVRRVDGRLISERATYELTGPARGWISVDGRRIELAPERDAFFRNHSWGFQPPRGRPTSFGAPTPAKRAPGVRQWVLFHLPDHCGMFFVDPARRAGAPTGAILTAERTIPITGIRHQLELYEGGRRLRRSEVQLTTADGRVRSYTFTDLGWIYCQGGGYFGGFDDGLGQGVYRGDYHEEREVWDVSHPTTILDADGRAFEVEHAWAESFTTVECDGQQGVAHYECVVFGDGLAGT